MVRWYLKGDTNGSVTHTNLDDNRIGTLDLGCIGSEPNAASISDKVGDSINGDGGCFEMDSKTVERCKGEVVEREGEMVRLPEAGE